MNTEKIFSAYVTNLGKYNEGALIGRWVDFPTTPEEMQQVFTEIGINEQYEEYFITDYDCEITGLTDCFGEYENLSMLNFVANKIIECRILVEELEGMLELGEHTGDSIELIHLLENRDCFWYIPDVENDYDLGYYYLDVEGALYELQKNHSVLANYFDYEAYGRDIRFDEGGIFTSSGGYITRNGNSFTTVFTVDDEIPEEYRL